MNRPEAIENLVSDLAEVDNDAARRLEQILETAAEQSQTNDLIHLDIYDILDPAAIQEYATVWYQRQFRWKNLDWLSWLKWLRNILIFLLIAVTWLGLARARNVSQLTGVELAALFVIVGLSAAIHYWGNLRKKSAEDRALALRQRIDQKLWELSRQIAADRREQDMNTAAVKIHQAVNSFENYAQVLLDQTQNLLNVLTAEWQHLNTLAKERERELGDLKIFSNGLNEGAKNMIRYEQEVGQTYDQIHHSVEQFSQDVSEIRTQQQAFFDFMGTINEQVARLTDTMHLTGLNLNTVSDGLDHAFSQTANNSAQTLTALQELRDVALLIESGEKSLRETLVRVQDEYETIAANLKESTGGIASSSSALNQAITTLNQLKDELPEFAKSQEALTESLTNMAQQLKEGSESTTYALSGVKGVALVLSHNVDTLVKSVSQLDTAVSSFERQAEDLQERLEQGARLTPTSQTLRFLVGLGITITVSIIGAVWIISQMGIIR